MLVLVRQQLLVAGALLLFVFPLFGVVVGAQQLLVLLARSTGSIEYLDLAKSSYLVYWYL